MPSTRRSSSTAAMPRACVLPKGMRRFGAAAIIFFFIKGLVWLGLSAAVAWGAW